MSYAVTSSQKWLNYPLSMPFEWNDAAVGTEGQTVMEAYKIFLEGFFLPISRELSIIE